MAPSLTKKDLPSGWRLSLETEGAAVRSEGRFVAVVRPSQSSSKYVWSIQGYTSEHRVDSAPQAFKDADEWIRKEKAAIARAQGNRLW